MPARDCTLSSSLHSGTSQCERHPQAGSSTAWNSYVFNPVLSSEEDAAVVKKALAHAREESIFVVKSTSIPQSKYLYPVTFLQCTGWLTCVMSGTIVLFVSTVFSDLLSQMGIFIALISPPLRISLLQDKTRQHVVPFSFRNARPTPSGRDPTVNGGR
jgi:hypothetical protein